MAIENLTIENFLAVVVFLPIFIYLPLILFDGVGAFRDIFFTSNARSRR